MKPIWTKRFRLIAVSLLAMTQVSTAAASFDSCEKILNSAVEKSRERAERLAERSGKGLTVYKTIDQGSDRFLIRLLHGVPAGVRLVEPASLGVVRHYTRDLDAILAAKVLKTGPRELYGRENSVDLRYKDMTGVFFTTVDFDHNNLSGLANGLSDYVDFELPVDTGVLFIKDGYYLIPTTAYLHDWLADMYRNYKKTGKVEQTYKGVILDLEAQNWEPPENIPIRIVAYQKNGKRVEFEQRPSNQFDKRVYGSIWAASATLHEMMGRLERDTLIADLFERYSGADDQFQMGEQGRLTRVKLTVRQHVVLAFETFEKQVAFHKLDRIEERAGLNMRGVLRLALALHDIGKPIAVEQGDKSRQHEFTIPILRQQMKKLRFTPAEIKLAEALVGNDLIGQLIQGKIDGAAAYRKMRKLAHGANVSLKDFFELQSLFFVADAGSYPSLRGLFGYQNGNLFVRNPAYEKLHDRVNK